MNTAAAIEAFLEMMSAERGASPNTLDAYRRDLEDAHGGMPAAVATTRTAPTKSIAASLTSTS